jgi:hypothetical protein
MTVTKVILGRIYCDQHPQVSAAIYVTLAYLGREAPPRRSRPGACAAYAPVRQQIAQAGIACSSQYNYIYVAHKPHRINLNRVDHSPSTYGVGGRTF